MHIRSTAKSYGKAPSTTQALATMKLSHSNILVSANLLASTVRALVPIELVFTFGYGPLDTDGGSCERFYTRLDGSKAPYIDTLEQYWKEVETLVDRAVAGLDKVFEDSREGLLVRENLQAWFGLVFDQTSRQLVQKTDIDRLQIVESECL